MNERRAGSRALIITMASAFLLKLWVTSETRIIPAYAPHDGLNYLEHAKAIAMGLWFGPYDDLTLIKQPFFPIYMAGLQEFGIPLPIAHLLFYGLACFVACFAIKPLVRNPYFLSAIFVVLYFNPMENNGDSWLSTRAQVNPSLALMVISCAIGIYVRRRAGISSTLRWSLALGAAFAAFWLTREEAVWILPALAVLLFAYLYAAVRNGAWNVVRDRLLVTAVPLAIWALAVGTIMTINGVHYGWFTTAENTSPELVSAYDSLARIDPGVPTDPRFPVPHAARLIAYRVSPAARELAPSLDGAKGAAWGNFGCLQLKACGDIHGGWFIWAFRDSVSDAGYYATGAKARAFYVRLATEIDAACATGTIRCRPKGHTLAPPLKTSDLPLLAANFVIGARFGLTFSQFSTEPWHLVGPASVRPDYDFIVRSVDDGFPNEPAGIDDDLKRALLVDFGQTYQVLFPPWFVLALAAVVMRLVLAIRSRTNSIEAEYLIPLAAIVTGFASLVLVLALVDTLSFPSFNPEYLGPLFPLLILFVTITTANEAPGILHAIDRRLPQAPGFEC
jgi:hypothetical protein